jgi:Co/Zn/Cd efflux system component
LAPLLDRLRGGQCTFLWLQPNATSTAENPSIHIHALDQWQRSHNFTSASDHGEKRTTNVMMLTAIMMVVEIVAGTVFGSMALLADG